MGEVNIKEIAKLARFKLSDKEIEKFSKDLEEVKKMFDEIDKIEVSEEPCFHPIEVKNIMRKDKVKKCASLEEIFSNTEHRENNFFKGPKV
jgi:aspartyl-tRNA(Asn)/glutamyl-tRNA(Gln) amidotransferase subunit C